MKILIPNVFPGTKGNPNSQGIKLNPTNIALFQSRLNKNVSYHKVLGEEKKD